MFRGLGFLCRVCLDVLRVEGFRIHKPRVQGNNLSTLVSVKDSPDRFDDLLMINTGEVTYSISRISIACTVGIRGAFVVKNQTPRYLKKTSSVKEVSSTPTYCAPVSLGEGGCSISVLGVASQS